MMEKHSPLQDGPRTLVVGLVGMGDLVMMTPALAHLGDALPNTSFDFLGRKGCVEILGNHPALDECHSFTITRVRYLRQKRAQRLVGQLRRRQYERAIVFDRYRQVLDWLTEAGVPAAECVVRSSITGDVRTLADESGSSEEDLRHGYLDGEPVHISQQYVSFVEQLVGRPLDWREPEVHPAPADLAAAESLLRRHRIGSEPFWVVHAVVSSMRRRWIRGGIRLAHRAWPLESWVAMVREFLSARKGHVLLSGARNEALHGRRLRRQLPAELRSRVHPIAGRTPPLVLAALLARSRGYVGVDTGPMHVAKAMGAPVLALYGPTDPAVCGPRGPGGKALVVRNPVPCSPCRGEVRRQCLDNVCMSGIDPAAVLQRLAGPGWADPQA